MLGLPITIRIHQEFQKKIHSIILLYEQNIYVFLMSVMFCRPKQYNRIQQSVFIKIYFENNCHINILNIARLI